MKAFTHLVVLVVLCLLAPLVQAAETVYLPIPVVDKIAVVESTELDIGEPKDVFDASEKTLIRTPSINPAYIRVEFTEPVTFDYLRILLIDCRHIWSVSMADSIADLRAKSGSYKTLFKDQDSPKGRIERKLDKPVTAKAFELEVRRMEGDDYVHILDWQFCKPTKADKLRILQLTDRRDDTKLEEVTGKLTKPIYTVVVFKARAAAGEAEIDIDNDVVWQTLDDGIVPFGENKGEFLVKKVGEHKLAAQYGDYKHTFIIEGTKREIKNREPDIDVWYIERLPRIDFDGPNGGWPEPGSNVTWRAHVYNWGKEPVNVKYEWKLDGKVIKTGEATIPVGPPNTWAKAIDLPWKWEQTRHDLSFTVKPVKPLKELIDVNNSITIQTNAVTVGFWVEQSLWEFFHEHQHRLPTNDSNSFAGWSQRMMRQWNKMFEEAVYEEFPNGIVERVRLDKLVIVPDFALPLAGGLPSNNPDLRDKTIDMQWGHESGDISVGTIVDEKHWWSPEKAIKALEDGSVENRKIDPPFWCGLGYIHEMGHARYLVDSYGFNVHSGVGDDLTKRNIKITDEKGPILGRYMPLDKDIQHRCKYPGQMASDYWYYSVYETMCWNRVAGKRARGGNCNAPATIGEFLQEIPERLIYQFFDTEGNPLADADIWVYRARGTGKDWYTKVYEDTPGVKARTDAEGRVVLDKTMFAEDGRIRHTYGFSNSVVLVRVTYKGQHYFLFEEITDPNLAYNLGYKDEYTFKRQIKLRTGEPSPNEWDYTKNWDVPGTGFGKRL
ncbi:MAG TPA: hypothetical protein PLP86_07135 [Armatimonadota bacterium]|nr:hypothetical protein [Armatimonadota bacterium]